MRLHQPVGILLLWYPTIWALWIANHGLPPFWLISYFLLGTIVMRSAGCIVNDIADRAIDKHVKRTAMRPLTTGEIGLWEAGVWLMILLTLALFIVIQLPVICFFYAIIALFVTATYPFCKRFFEAPQLILGVAFSMGIPMAFVASHVVPNVSMTLLFILNFAWIVSYDTMYAMVDREDDVRIGVKSTAVLFGRYDLRIILSLQILFQTIWVALAVRIHCSSLFYVFWLLSGIVLIHQQRLLRQRHREAYFSAFFTNVGYGLLMWIALMVGMPSL
jgi:4-hydroxybenzoate polyprenyltransferase